MRRAEEIFSADGSRVGRRKAPAGTRALRLLCLLLLLAAGTARAGTPDLRPAGPQGFSSQIARGTEADAVAPQPASLIFASPVSAGAEKNGRAFPGQGEDVDSGATARSRLALLAAEAQAALDRKNALRTVDALSGFTVAAGWEDEASRYEDPEEPVPLEADEFVLWDEPAAGETDGEGILSEPGTEPEPPARAAEAKKNPSAGVRLFGTVEFRGPIKNLPKWERVLREEKKAPSFGAGADQRLPPKVAKSWKALRARLAGRPLKEQMTEVNKYFNQWPYKTDMAVWRVEDYWATPAEFVRNSGDCEDYAIAKYYALRDLGVPVEKLRVAAVKDTIRNIGHAVAVVYMDDTAYILDNMSNLVLVHTRLKHYAPVYSVNEKHRWVHVKPVNKPQAGGGK